MLERLSSYGPGRVSQAGPDQLAKLGLWDTGGAHKAKLSRTIRLHPTTVYFTERVIESRATKLATFSEYVEAAVLEKVQRDVELVASDLLTTEARRHWRAQRTWAALLRQDDALETLRTFKKMVTRFLVHGQKKEAREATLDIWRTLKDMPANLKKQGYEIMFGGDPTAPGWEPTDLEGDEAGQMLFDLMQERTEPPPDPDTISIQKYVLRRQEEDE
jgi:hypothetical protein